MAAVTLEQVGGSAVSYEMGYLDGLADAVNFSGWVAAGDPRPRRAFQLHVVRDLRKAARAALKLQLASDEPAGVVPEALCHAHAVQPALIGAEVAEEQACATGSTPPAALPPGA